MPLLSNLKGNMHVNFRRWRTARERRTSSAEAVNERIDEQKWQSMFLYGLGNDFEETVASMFDPECFELIHQTPRHDENGGRYVRGMIYPDLRFVEKSTGRRFWVECKYRARAGPNWDIEWCSWNQLTRYKSTMHHYREPVLIIIGIGGTARHPRKVYCMNLERVNFTTLHYWTYKDNRLHGRVTNLDELLALAD